MSGTEQARVAEGDLRRRAEARLENSGACAQGSGTPDLCSLMRELQVHQAELELQC